MILAAGLGTRLRPLSESLPKALFPVANRPLIEYSIRLLAHHGITDLVVNLFHQPRLLEAELGRGERWGVSIAYSPEEELLGTGGALRKAADLLGDETFLVINSDVIFDLDLEAVIQRHRETGARATLVLRPDPAAHDYGPIEVDLEGRVRRFLGKGEWDGPLSTYMFTGCAVLEPEVLEYIPPDIPISISEYTYPKMIANGEPIYSYVSHDFWADLGTPQRYWNTNLAFLEKRVQLHHFDPLENFEFCPKKEVLDVVRIGANVSLAEEVQLNPPVLIGDGVRLGPGAIIGPRAVIGDGCVIGRGSRVQDSILFKGTRLADGEALANHLLCRKVGVEI